MPLIGHGIDLTETARIRSMLDEHADRFLERCFTPREVADAGDGPRRVEHLAARFAAKEAALKALGTGWSRGVGWTDVEVVRTDSGRPELFVTGRAGEIAAQRGITRWHVSLTHTKDHAVASVIAEG
jgi:holo-[acyl-carrier protein] synthase